MKTVKWATTPSVDALTSSDAIDLELINAAEQRLNAEVTVILEYPALCED
jgi:hypothetical protein